jgi:hypothetical protein
VDLKLAPDNAVLYTGRYSNRSVYTRAICTRAYSLGVEVAIGKLKKV